VNRALRAATLGVLLLSPVALSACSAGHVTQTATQDRDKVGAMAAAGDIALRKAHLEHPGDDGYAAGDDAVLLLAIANGSDEADTLTEVSGEGFDEAVISASGAASASTGSTTPAATRTAASSELEIPARSSVFIGEKGSPTITLEGLDEELTTGRYLELTFTFENAGDVTILVPVGNPTEEVERGEAFDFHHEEEAGSEESAEGAQREGGE
jgi:copper(I)-binding protein